MPDAGTAFDGSVWLAGPAILNLVVGSAAVTALGAGVVGAGLSRLSDEALAEDDKKQLDVEAGTASQQKGEEPAGSSSRGRERIKR